MSTIKYKKKEPAGTPGNFKYTYECTCNDRTKKVVEVESANDNEAKQLAQIDCDEKCGET